MITCTFTFQFQFQSSAIQFKSAILLSCVRAAALFCVLRRDPDAARSAAYAVNDIPCGVESRIALERCRARARRTALLDPPREPARSGAPCIDSIQEAPRLRAIGRG